MKFTAIVCCLLFYFIFIPSSSYASNFLTRAEVTYNVQKDGITQGDFAITLENTTDMYRATSYSFQVGFTTLTNISAYDPNGPITPEIIKENGVQTIKLTFNSKIDGKGNKLPFHIHFQTPEIAQRTGQTWEINIPGIAQDNNFTSFNVTVSVPPSFGNPTYIKPPQTTRILSFTKEQLGNAGITVGFGTKRAYNFSLRYHLENPNLFPITTEIALPPQTNYQTVSVIRMDPKPMNTHQDEDGNWLATYSLLPGKKLLVDVTGQVVVALFPLAEILSPKQRQVYLMQKQYWEVTNPTISTLSKSLKTPEAIYNYVVSKLHYDFSRIKTNQQRLGALSVLQHPDSAVCLEFTDLFVTLARAAGIPAREVDGYAYTQNTSQRPLSLLGDVLHAWPEYYDNANGQWVMVDPTWENTTEGVDYFHTFDFDHITLVIRGNSSTYPIPAGGYKSLAQEEEKDVHISFAESLPKPAPSFSAHIATDPAYYGGLPIHGTLLFTNTGTTFLPSQTIQVYTSLFTPRVRQLTIPALLPFGSAQIPVEYEGLPFLTNVHDTLTIQVAGRTIRKTIAVYPFFFQPVIVIGGFISVSICIIIFIITTKAWRIFFSR